MLYGTDLDFAYPGMYGPSTGTSGMMETSAAVAVPVPKVQTRTQSGMPAKSNSRIIEAVDQQVPVVSQAQQSSSQQQQQAVYVPQVQQQQQRVYVPSYADDASYMEKLSHKRRDLWKLLLYAFIILTALSIHMVTKQAIKFIIREYDLSIRNTWLLRTAYPLLVIFLMWNIKAVALI